MKNLAGYRAIITNDITINDVGYLVIYADAIVFENGAGISGYGKGFGGGGGGGGQGGKSADGQGYGGSFGAANGGKTLLRGPKRAKPPAVGVFVVQGKNEQHAADQ